MAESGKKAKTAKNPATSGMAKTVKSLAKGSKATTANSSKARAKSAKPSQSRTVNAPNFARLQKVNGWAALLFALQGIAVLVAGTSRAVSVVTNYLAKDQLASQHAKHMVLVSVRQTIFGIPLGYVAAAALFVAAIGYGVMAKWAKEYYERDLKSGINSTRSLVFPFINAAVLLGVALVAGVHSLAALVMVVALAFVSGFLVMIMESANKGQKEITWHPFVLAAASGVIPWIIFAIYLLSSVIFGAGVSGAAIGIVCSVFGLYVLGGLGIKFHFRKILKFEQTSRYEYHMLLITFVTLAAFTWQIYAGYLQP
jgi:hypothetical protein